MVEARTTCPQCGTEIAKGARFCGECGTPVPESTGGDKPLRGSHTILGLDAEAVKAAAALLEAKSKAAAAEAARAEVAKAEAAKGGAAKADSSQGAKTEAAKPEVAKAEAPKADVTKGDAPRADASKAVGAFAEAATERPAPSAGASAITIESDEDAAPPQAATPQAAAQPQHDKPELSTPANASRRPLGHTILGLSASQLPQLGEAGKPRAHTPSSGESTSAGGYTAPLQPDASEALTPSGAKPTPKRTLLGIQSSSGAIAAPSAAAFAKTRIEGEPLGDILPSEVGAAPLDFGATRIEGAARPGGHARHATALGIGLPAAPQTAPKSVQGRTMLGVPLSSLSPLPPAAEGGELPAADSGGQTRPGVSAWDAEGRNTRPSTDPALRTTAAGSGNAARSRIALVLAGLALLSLVAMVYVRFSGRTKSADVSARITTNQQGESLLFEVPQAAEGSKLRFGGQEQPLVAGRATFPLASDSLRVGDNIVLADVIAPNGETSSARIVLAVFYRIWVDTSALRADRPSIDVVVTAIPGTKVTLEGQDVQLDAQGRATKTYALDVVHSGKGGVIDHVVHYRMQPPRGETVVDELHTRIPVAMMQIDRPGPDIVTDRETVEIAGAVGRDTQVSIDGTQVPVKEGRFLHRLALPRPGDYKPRVIASATGKAPLGVTLSIRRVRDIAQAAREFTFDKSLTYAKIASNPTIYKGQNIAIEGRVYAVDARSGSSVLQMLARPCPSTQRCSLWVVDPQAGEVSVDRWVRVLGVVEGEQQFRSEKNEIVTVPKITARFVLPAKP